MYRDLRYRVLVWNEYRTGAILIPQPRIPPQEPSALLPFCSLFSPSPGGKSPAGYDRDGQEERPEDLGWFRGIL